LIFTDTAIYYLAPVLVTPLIIIFVTNKRALTRSGLALALVMDIAVSIALGNYGFVLLVSFFVLSVAVDKVKKFNKQPDHITKKGDCRDVIQVFANGIVPMVLAILYVFTHHGAFIIAYVAALSEAFADTAASGFGIFSKKTYDLFKARSIERGLSGGMSVIGTSAALVGSLFIPLIALAMGLVDWRIALIAAACAFAGVIFDSLLGSLLQIKYKCSHFRYQQCSYKANSQLYHRDEWQDDESRTEL
jgi:uncharacterized protein (TIGR00297 family)